MDKAELRRIAAASGLARLTDKHLEQLAASIKSNEDLARRLPKDLGPGDEMALAFRLAPGKEAGR